MNLKNKSSMIRYIVVFFVLFATVTFGNTSSQSAEKQDSRSKLQIDVRTLLHEQKFNELENMASIFRKEKTRFPDGGWKLYTFYNSFHSAYYGWNEHLRNHDTWLKLYPNSITARVAAAALWSTYAWEARGGGYANTVTEEGWKLYRERLAKAYEFVKNPPSDPSKDCMHRYYVLLLIARAQGWDRKNYEEIFQKGLSFEPSYYANYFEKATYLFPRWYGEKGEWQKFAAETVKFAPKSEGMGIYTRILLFAWSYKEFTDFKVPDISWEKMKKGFRDIDRNYPDSSLILNWYCRFACIAEDKKTAAELFMRIGDDPFVEAWDGRSNYYKWRKWSGID